MGNGSGEASGRLGKHGAEHWERGERGKREAGKRRQAREAKQWASDKRREAKQNWGEVGHAMSNLLLVTNYRSNWVYAPNPGRFVGQTPTNRVGQTLTQKLPTSIPLYAPGIFRRYPTMRDNESPQMPAIDRRKPQ